MIYLNHPARGRHKTREYGKERPAEICRRGDFFLAKHPACGSCWSRGWTWATAVTQPAQWRCQILNSLHYTGSPFMTFFKKQAASQTLPNDCPMVNTKLISWGQTLEGRIAYEAQRESNSRDSAAPQLWPLNLSFKNILITFSTFTLNFNFNVYNFNYIFIIHWII